MRYQLQYFSNNQSGQELDKLDINVHATVLKVIPVPDTFNLKMLKLDHLNNDGAMSIYI